MATFDDERSRTVEPLEKARRVSQALADAARFARTVTRKRPGDYTHGGFHARRGARLFSLARTATFVIFVVLPSLVVAAYFGLIATDQYVAEARFTVGSGEVPQLDKIGSITGLAAASVVQDTQIVTNYIGSRAAIEAVRRTVDLTRAYADPSIDRWSRFDASESIEKFVRYWNDMHSTSIALPGGLVTFRVRAFTPQDALHIAEAFVRASEGLVNDLNTRAFTDTMRSADAELQRATDRLGKARLAVEKARNTEGVLDAVKAGDALNALILETRSSLLQLQQEYNSKVLVVSPSAPQLKVLKDRIDVTSRQIAELESKLTSTRDAVDNGLTISATMSRFAELDLEKQIAERLYAGAVASVELARIVADQRRIYLNEFVRPALPEQPQYPRRWLMSLLWIGGFFAAWGVAWGLGTLVRDYMA